MIRFFIALLLLLTSASLLADCPPPAHMRTELLDLRDDGFVLTDSSARQSLAVALLDCVGDPDPQIRDGVVFAAYSTWLRADLLDTATVNTLMNRLLLLLNAPEGADFGRPFAALNLSEVARTDRIEAAFSTAQRETLVAAAAAYLPAVQDYRGYSDQEGWRHGVVHGADLVLQLILNPAITPAQQQRLLKAVASQVSPHSIVFYHYGEPGRLARPVLYAYQRGELDESFWDSWFTAVSSAAPLASWADAWKSRAGLARRHNTVALLQALYVATARIEAEWAQSLASRAQAALREVG